MAKSRLFDEIKTLFPHGTRGLLISANKTRKITASKAWDHFPRWPPDLFAISAYLLDKLDGYTLLISEDEELKSSVAPNECISKFSEQLGRTWRNVNNQKTLEDWKRTHRPNLDKLWQDLVSTTKRVILTDPYSPEQQELTHLTKKLCIELLIISDEASSGIGGYNLDTWVQLIYTTMYSGKNEKIHQKMLSILQDQQEEDWIIEALTASIDNLDEAYSETDDSTETPDNNPRGQKEKITAGLLATEKIACVQPKIKVPSVGCTLRSLSKNLSLLPPQTKVTANWNNDFTAFNKDKEFNILAIPFPYFIDNSSFQAMPDNQADSRSTYNKFHVDQSWLRKLDSNDPAHKTPGSDDPHPETSTALTQLLQSLVKQSKELVEKIDAVIFPELALDTHAYKRLYQFLCDIEEGKEDVNKVEDDVFSVLISGVLEQTDNQNSNCAYTTIVADMAQNLGEEVMATKSQHKHHRWLLDSNQIKQYGLTSVLDPAHSWWEDTPIKGRTVNFVPFRENCCFTTLICEDLARIDPCHQVVRAIGPNLVFALLMDGSQIKGRWPERYAMGLSDDPGSSVFTFTSLGLVRRSSYFHKSPLHHVGLWRDPIGGTQELHIPDGYHGLLMNLHLENKTSKTLDGRTVNNDVWKLNCVNPLRAHDSKFDV